MDAFYIGLVIGAALGFCLCGVMTGNDVKES